MDKELTLGLLESVEAAVDELCDFARILQESHRTPDGWDSEDTRKQHQNLMKHSFRLECFAKALGAKLRN